MNLSDADRIYCLGIGGIGMSALARYFHARGKTVGGYDRTPTALTDELAREGIRVHFTDDIGQVDAEFTSSPERTLVIVTPAVPAAHGELAYFRKNGFTVMKRSEVLGRITRESDTVAVAGTHGKTTTSTMIAHLFQHSGTGCTAFLGGISSNYNSNLLLPADAANRRVVVEADEYDRSFLTLHPDIAVITSMDADHLDIYGDAASVQEAYRLFASQVKPGGLLILRKGLTAGEPAVPVRTYSATGEADYRADNIRIEGHRFRFDWTGPGETIADIVTAMPGRHNVENAVAAIAVARQVNIAAEAIREAFRTFSGIRRRFDYRLESGQLVYIDDYAHHPEELKACILAARELYPDRPLCGIFQPHLYSRTRDFAEAFARSLSLLDEVILLDIYPAREQPIEGVTSDLIFSRITSKQKIRCRKEEVAARMKGRTAGVVLTLGAGDIDTLVEPVRRQLQENLKTNHVS
jgi:UDP-N-acetylmuramate--alanine ligase